MAVAILKVYGDGVPFDAASVEITPEFRDRALMLAETLRSLGAESIEEYDYRVVPMEDRGWDVSNLVEADVRLDCVRVCVTEHDVGWSGFVKHEDAKWVTQSIPLDLLYDLSNLDAPQHDLRELSY